MRGIKNFIIGFGLSFISVSLGGLLYTPANAQKRLKPQESIAKIDLFKPAGKISTPLKLDIFADIDKQSFGAFAAANKAEPNDLLSPGREKHAENSQAGEANLPNNEGLEDAEILSVNVEDMIPIDYDNEAADLQQAEILYESTEEQAAMLPLAVPNEDAFVMDDPWVVAKGSKHVKNKKILEKYGISQDDLPAIDRTAEAKIDESELSYKVAERIKQSIIFPIPDEILNDENLTPTFIQEPEKKDIKKKKNPKPAATPQAKKQKLDNEAAAEGFKILQKNSSQEENKDSFLGSISSWFSNKQETESKPAKAKPAPAPSYSSQGEVPQKEASIDSKRDLVSFYETLQETQDEYAQKRIIPSELKLSFQPGRAEISGQTLNWLKTFSDATKDGTCYLQVRLDASASVELQRKRLNLLYTIFMNNGVDFKKIDTVFSSTEPNAFIIRTLKLK